MPPEASMVKRSFLATASLLGALAAGSPAISVVVAQSPAFVPVTDATLTRPEPGDWLHISRTYNQHRFSPLDQINKANVGQLRMARSEEHTSELQSQSNLVCRLLLEKKKKKCSSITYIETHKT